MIIAFVYSSLNNAILYVAPETWQLQSQTKKIFSSIWYLSLYKLQIQHKCVSMTLSFWSHAIFFFPEVSVTWWDKNKLPGRLDLGLSDSRWPVSWEGLNDFQSQTNFGCNFITPFSRIWQTHIALVSWTSIYIPVIGFDNILRRRRGRIEWYNRRHVKNTS